MEEAVFEKTEGEPTYGPPPQLFHFFCSSYPEHGAHKPAQSGRTFYHNNLHTHTPFRLAAVYAILCGARQGCAEDLSGSTPDSSGTGRAAPLIRLPLSGQQGQSPRRFAGTPAEQ